MADKCCEAGGGIAGGGNGGQLMRDPGPEKHEPAFGNGDVLIFDAVGHRRAGQEVRLDMAMPVRRRHQGWLKDSHPERRWRALANKSAAHAGGRRAWSVLGSGRRGPYILGS